MLNDFEIVFHDLRKYDKIDLLFMGDKHIGSLEFDETLFLQQIEEVRKNKNARLIICGDLLDTGIVGSKTSVYEQAMTPHEQKIYLFEALKPIAGKIVAMVPGNHEARISKSCGINTLYDVAAMLDITEVYRENFAVVKLHVGVRDRDKTKSNCYIGVVSHGSSNAKHQKWTTSFDGADFFISGHTHTPSYTPRGKLKIDPYNNKVRHVGYKEIVVDSGLSYGGYAIKAEYMPTAVHERQLLVLSGKEKKMRFIAEEY